jgi:hypothetical protein
MKRLLTLLDCTAISITMLFLVGLAAMALRGLFLQLRELLHDIYAARGDWWIAGLLVFCLIWTVFRWKAGLRALDDIDT